MIKSASHVMSDKAYREAGSRLYALIRRHEFESNPALAAIRVRVRPTVDLSINQPSVRDWTRDQISWNLPQNIFIVVGLRCDELEEHREICLRIMKRDVRDFFSPMLQDQVDSPRGWRSKLSFKTIGSFGLYKVRRRDLRCFKRIY